MSKECCRCGGRISDDAAFCRSCGAKQVAREHTPPPERQQTAPFAPGTFDAAADPYTDPDAEILLKRLFPDEPEKSGPCPPAAEPANRPTVPSPPENIYRPTAPVPNGNPYRPTASPPNGNAYQPTAPVPNGNPYRPTAPVPYGNPYRPTAPVPNGNAYRPTVPIPNGNAYPPPAPVPNGNPYQPTAPPPNGNPYRPTAPVPNGNAYRPTVPIPNGNACPPPAPVPNGNPYQPTAPIPNGNAYQPTASAPLGNPYPQAAAAAGRRQDPPLPMAHDLVSPDSCRLNPVVSAVLSVLVVGLSQMLNGQLAKGLLMLGMTILVCAFFSGWFALAFCAVSGADAALCARRLRSGRPIGRMSMF